MEEHNKSEDEHRLSLSRRNVLKSGSLLLTLPFVSLKLRAAPEAEKTASLPTDAGEKVVATCSTFDCGGKCDIRAHVTDGVVTRISTRPDNELDPEMPIMRACVRGRGYRKFVYHPDRLSTP